MNTLRTNQYILIKSNTLPLAKNISLFSNSTLPQQVIKTYNGEPFKQPYGILESCVRPDECFYFVTDGPLIVKLDANFSFISKYNSKSPFP